MGFGLLSIICGVIVTGILKLCGCGWWCLVFLFFGWVPALAIIEGAAGIRWLKGRSYGKTSKKSS